VSESLAAEGWAVPVTGVEAEFTDAGGKRRRELLAACWDARFEEAVPVRPFRWAAGQRHFPGWWWSATTVLTEAGPVEVAVPRDRGWANAQ